MSDLITHERWDDVPTTSTSPGTATPRQARDPREVALRDERLVDAASGARGGEAVSLDARPGIGAVGATRERRVREVADRLGLDALLDRRPAELTLAQQQRVAIGRAIVRRPEVLLMGAPCSGLSGDARDQARQEIAPCCDVLAMTTIVVSDDQGDADTIGHRIVRLERTGTRNATVTRTPA